MRPRNPQTAQQGFLNRISLTSWIFIALIAGTLLGTLCNLVLPQDSSLFTAGINGFCFVIGRGFIRLMQMLVVPLVFTSIVCGAAAMGSGSMLGRVGGMTMILYTFTTFVAISLALALGLLINPGVGLDLGAITKIEVSAPRPFP